MLKDELLGRVKSNFKKEIKNIKGDIAALKSGQDRILSALLKQDQPAYVKKPTLFISNNNVIKQKPVKEQLPVYDPDDFSETNFR
jgi:hypothetical protein